MYTYVNTNTNLGVKGGILDERVDEHPDVALDLKRL